MAATPAKKIPPRPLPTAKIDYIVKQTGRPRAEVIEAYLERAAIRQSLGDLDVEEAEQRAVGDTIAILGLAPIAGEQQRLL